MPYLFLPGLFARGRWRRRRKEKKIGRTSMGQKKSSLSAETPVWRGRDPPSSLGASIGQTYEYLARKRPEILEEDAVRRAVELSLLDCALVLRTRKSFRGAAAGDGSLADDASEKERPPHEVLRVPPDATLDEIRAAYRRQARATHPDKGGNPADFEAVARAYRLLLDVASGHPRLKDSAHGGGGATVAIKNTAHWDKELQEHKNLVQELFQAHGADVDAVVAKQGAALEAMGLKAKEAGSLGRNERDEVIRNSCFYLSLAVSYLSGIGALASSAYGGGDGAEEDEALRNADEALIHDSALQLKRIIEAAVVSAHPEWASRGLVGEEVQAFSDFLVYVLDSPTLVSDWAVAIFDAASGFVDVYKGKNFPEDDDDWARNNTLTVRYEPGHYQPILPRGDDGSRRPALGELLDALNEAGVIYVVTDGSA